MKYGNREGSGVEWGIVGMVISCVKCRFLTETPDPVIVKVNLTRPYTGIGLREM